MTWATARDQGAGALIRAMADRCRTMGGYCGIVAVPDRDQVAGPLDHDGLPPAAFAASLCAITTWPGATSSQVPGRSWAVGSGFGLRRLVAQRGARPSSMYRSPLMYGTRPLPLACRRPAGSRGRNFGHVRIGDLDQPQVHGLGSLCQQVRILRREPGRPWLGIFVGAEQNVDFGRRLRRFALFRRCDLFRSLGPFGPVWQVWRVWLVSGFSWSWSVSLNHKGARRGPLCDVVDMYYGSARSFHGSLRG